jgi:hypothetical protein
MSVAVDHVVLVSVDPEATATRLLERTGLATVPGGVHEDETGRGLGTRNAIVPLGPAYLEIVEVHDEGRAAGNGFGRLVLSGLRSARRAGRTESLLSWAVAVPDVVASASDLSEPTLRLRRRGVAVTLTGLDVASIDPGRPFLLGRDPGDPFPGHIEAGHRVRPTGIAALSIGRSGRPDWPDDLPVGATELNLQGGSAPSLIRVVISGADAMPIVLSADHPTGAV